MDAPRPAATALSAEHVGELAVELARVVVGGTVSDVAALPPRDLILVLEHADWPGVRRVRVCAAADGPRVHVQQARVHRHEGSVGPFFERVRSELDGARLIGVEQVRGDRLMLLRFEASGGRRALLAELVGRHANLLLLDGSERVLEWLVPPKPPKDAGAKPRLALGAPYVPPPGRASGAVGSGVRATFAQPTTSPRDAELAPLSWIVECALGALVDGVERDRAAKHVAERLEKKRDSLARTLHGLRQRELAAEGAERVRQDGEILKASMSQLRRGLDHVELADWFAVDGAPRRIALDPKLSPRENVEKYFDRYHKLVRSAASLADELTRNEERAAVVARLLADLASGAEPAAIEARAVSAGVLDALAVERGKRVQVAAPRLPYRTFTTARGGTVLVGRTAKDNDVLSLKIARGNDVWLHTADTPGSHVVLRVEKGQEPHDEDVIDAAHLAVHFSPLRGATKANVTVARRKDVHKPKGAPAGLVTLSGGKSRAVRIEPDRLTRLLAGDATA
jgi:predicted ribosome quality control (RQC) complex YloA/Tae2 family protein